MLGLPFSLPWGIAGWLTHVYQGGMAGVTSALKGISQHTGIPVILVAALALVLSYRLVRRATRLAGEMLIAVALVLAATKLGWIQW